MLTIAETDTNDIFISNDGRLAMVSGLAAFGTAARAAMETRINEMLYAYDEGMPFFETAFNNYNAGQFEAAARGVILSVPGALSVDSFVAERTGQTLKYKAVIKSIYGTAEISNG